MLTHQSELIEKCTVPNCEYNKKGFARKHDKNRHTLTHFEGTLVCGFCPSLGTSTAKTFNRADVFKRHLVNVHGAEPVPLSLRQRSVPGLDEPESVASTPNRSIARCSCCPTGFNEVQAFYDHLDDCVLRVIEEEGSKDHMSGPAMSAFSGALPTGFNEEDEEDDELDQDGEDDEDDEDDELVQKCLDADEDDKDVLDVLDDELLVEGLKADGLEDRARAEQRRTAELLEGEKRGGSGPGPMGGLTDLVVVEGGLVEDSYGNVVGRVVEGELEEVIGKSVNEVGQIVDEDGYHTWGRCEPYEQPEKEEISEDVVRDMRECIEGEEPAMSVDVQRRAGLPFHVDITGDIRDEKGEIIAKLVEGNLRECVGIRVSVCAGEETGPVYDEAWKWIGKVALLNYLQADEPDALAAEGQLTASAVYDSSRTSPEAEFAEAMSDDDAAPGTRDEVGRRSPVYISGRGSLYEKNESERRRRRRYRAGRRERENTESQLHFTRRARAGQRPSWSRDPSPDWKPPGTVSAVDQTDAMPFYSKQATPRENEGDKIDDGVDLDWSKVEDPHTRRKIQNRLAQRKFRDSRRRLVETGKYEETWSARDVVDELLEQWTTLSTAEMVDARKEVVDTAGFVSSAS